MSIVIITIPGESKRSVVAQLQAKTECAVALVVVQKPKQYTMQKTVQRWLSGPEKISALYYGTLLRLQPRLRHCLELFRARPLDKSTPNWSAPVLETDDVNHPSVIEQIQKLKPTVLAVWGSTILTQELVHSAPRSINLHMGHAPEYRGAIANQRAVQRHDFSHVGFTIHHINGKADAGRIIEKQQAKLHADPKTTFVELNNAAEAAFVDTVAALYQEHELPTIPQNIAHGENVRLREWTPQMRYQVACIIKQWHDSKRPPHSV